MNKYSVWYMPYNKRYLITHPWQWVRCAYRNIRDAWRRSVYGWTYGDVWDWNNWFTHVVPDMLRHMADKGSAYPGCEPFDTPEKWHEWLHHMANLIESADETWQDEHNEYCKEYTNHLMDNWRKPTVDENGMMRWALQPQSEISKKYFARAQELAKTGEENIAQALVEIGQHFSSLWD